MMINSACYGSAATLTNPDPSFHHKIHGAGAVVGPPTEAERGASRLLIWWSRNVRKPQDRRGTLLTFFIRQCHVYVSIPLMLEVGVVAAMRFFCPVAFVQL